MAKRGWEGVILWGVGVWAVVIMGVGALTSAVFQQPYLFDGSIVENVRVGHPEADDAALATAAELARVEPILGRLPRGWDSPVGEG